MTLILALACASFAVALVAYAMTTLEPRETDTTLSIRLGWNPYKRGAWLRKTPGKPAVWAIVGKRFAINRGYFFNV